jgi:hypothetical protein
MKPELDPELKELFSKLIQPGNAKKTTTSSPSKHRPHNHFPMGKTGYVPQSAGDNTKSNNPVRPGAEAKPGESGSTPLADTSAKKGTTTAICPDCKNKFEISIDEAKALYEKLGGVYCVKCRDKPSEAKHDETKHQEKKEGETAKVDEPKARSEEPKIKEISMEEKLPVKQEPTKVPAKKTDAEIDEMIELAKAEKFLKGQGGSYSVSGKNRPDSAMVQKFANAADISSEILFAEQTKDYAHVVVRGHRGNKYVDAVVHHDYETEFQLQTMEIVKKNSEILDHYEGLIPVLKEGATIKLGDKVADAKYHLIHTLLSFKTFSLRDATTKAMNIVQMKLLNQDAREPEEIASEQKERDLVEERRRSR